MKKIFILLLFASHISLAQETQKAPNLRLKIAKAIAQHSDKALLGQTPAGFAYLFSVTLSFDHQGKIDSVYFPRQISENVKKVMKPDAALARRIKDQESTYKIYADKFVFIPVFYHNSADDTLDYRSGFIGAFKNLLPEINTSANKQWIILDPLTEQFSPSIR